LTVNAFSLDGRFRPLTVTDRLTASPPAFGVALAHAWPSEHDAAEVAAAAVTALDIDDGPSYTQVRIGPAGPRVMEVAARLGGGHDAELCELALGVDLNALAIEAALGERPGAPRAEPRAGGACVRFLVAPAGTLDVVDGVEQAAALPGIAEVRVYRAPGHRFAPLRVGADRAGAVLAVGDDRDDALARAGAAASRIVFRRRRST
jgi:biotin carboxylase